MTGWQISAFKMEIGTQTSLLIGIFSWLTPYAWWADALIVLALVAFEHIGMKRSEWQMTPAKRTRAA